MSIEKHLEDRGIVLTEDNVLEAGHRTLKNFKRVIAAVRSAEAESNDAINKWSERYRVSQDRVVELQEENHALKDELRRYKVKEQLSELEALTIADRQKLLEVA